MTREHKGRPGDVYASLRERSRVKTRAQTDLARTTPTSICCRLLMKLSRAVSPCISRSFCRSCARCARQQEQNQAQHTECRMSIKQEQEACLNSLPRASFATSCSVSKSMGNLRTAEEKERRAGTQDCHPWRPHPPLFTSFFA